MLFECLLLKLVSLAGGPTFLIPVINITTLGARADSLVKAVNAET